MTRDRLDQLHQILKKRGEEPYDSKHGYDNVALEIEDEDGPYMEHFFRRVEEIRGWIDKVNENVEEIKLLNSKILSSPRPEDHIKNELDVRTDSVKVLGKKIGVNLKDLEKKIKEEEEESEYVKTGLRIRKTQLAASLHMFIEAMGTFNQAQMDYKDRCMDRITRVVSIAQADITEEKLEEMLEKGTYATVFNGDIITETMDAKKSLEEVQQRHEQILKLEKSIMELRDLFVDMAFLVSKQGDLIDNIESNVCSASELVEAAKDKTKSAIKYQSKARMKKIIILIIGLVILLAVILAVTTWPKKK